ncbi:putative nucleolar protein 10/Enp2 [Helianthus annuus]|nr:putative nucleolar protein 10/Enp2 [Helianthus annuus]
MANLSLLQVRCDYMERVDLIQDLRFETTTTRIKATPDGEFLIASGYWELVFTLYKLKVYELRDLSLKFERHLVSEIINFQVLSDDYYSNLAFLCADRLWFVGMLIYNLSIFTIKGENANL